MVRGQLKRATNHLISTISGDFTDAELEKAGSAADRFKIVDKRLTEGWMLYSLLELKQRYLIDGSH